MPGDDEAGPEDYGQDFEDVWSEIPGSSWLEEQGGEVLQTAMDLMWVGFFDPDASPDERYEARADFFEYTGLGYIDENGDLHSDLFPWDDWREAMGYE